MITEEKARAYADKKIENTYGISSKAFREAGCRLEYKVVVQAYLAGATEALASQCRHEGDGEAVHAPNIQDIEEVWQDIPGYYGQYQASNLGRIRSFKHRHGYRATPLIVKGHRDSRGYLQVSIKNKLQLVHRIVAMTFIPNPDKLPIVNHKDENKLNNCVANLEWCTKQYNCTYGSAEQWKFTPVARVDTRSGEVLDFLSIAEASIKTQTPISTIHNALRGCSLSRNRYRWFYNQFLYNKSRGDKRLPIPPLKGGEYGM